MYGNYTGLAVTLRPSWFLPPPSQLKIYTRQFFIFDKLLKAPAVAA